MRARPLQIALISIAMLVVVVVLIGLILLNNQTPVLEDRLTPIQTLTETATFGVTVTEASTQVLNLPTETAGFEVITTAVPPPLNFTATNPPPITAVFPTNPPPLPTNTLIVVTALANTAEAVSAGFTARIAQDGTVQFSDTSVGTIINWFWNFGDGTTSSERNPIHRYANSGRYSVILTILSDQQVSDSITVDVIINIVPPAVVIPPTNAPTPTPLPTLTFTPMIVPTLTFTSTVTATETATQTALPTETATETLIPTETATQTALPTETATETLIPTETATQTALPTETATETLIPTETATETLIPTETATQTALPTETATE
nr:PKD domain-containing protein [Anaerolineae bacterium]